MLRNVLCLCGGLAVAALLAVLTTGHAQHPAPSAGGLPVQLVPGMGFPPGFGVSAPVPAPATLPARTKGLDELAAELASLRARKADLEKAEQALVAQMREKFQQHRQMLEKLGIVPQDAPRPPATNATAPTSVVPAGGIPAPDGSGKCRSRGCAPVQGSDDLAPCLPPPGK